MPRHRSLLLLFIVALSVFLMTYQSRKGPFLTSLTFVHSLVNSVHGAAESMADFFSAPLLRLCRGDQEEALRKRLDEALLENARYRETMIENSRLTTLLGLKERLSNVVTPARIIARGVDHWSKLVVLDKGSKDGISRDMAAATPSGLAGKITAVTDSSSYMLLLTDINFAAAVRMQESRREAVLAGTGTEKCILKYMPYDEAVKVGDIVVTSGLDALFPPGVSVGYVSKVDKQGRGGGFQYIEVIPLQNDARIEEVLVIK